MKNKFQVMLKEDFDEELNAMSACYHLLRPLSFDKQWRVINYLLARLLGRAWILNKPVSER